MVLTARGKSDAVTGATPTSWTWTKRRAVARRRRLSAPVDTNGIADVFVYDRQTGTTTRAVSSGGAQANLEIYEPSISADGRFVAFSSYADNLVSGDTNGTSDVVVYEFPKPALWGADPNAISTSALADAATRLPAAKVAARRVRRQAPTKHPPGGLARPSMYCCGAPDNGHFPGAP